MFRFCIFMSINKQKIEVKENVEKIRGAPIHITHISVESYHRLSNWVLNQSLDKVLLPNGTICQRSNLNIHEYLWKHEK